MAAEMVYATYIADNGTHNTVQVRAAYAGYAPLGWGAYSALNGELARNIEMRYVSLRAAGTGRSRRINVGAVTADLWTGVATTFSLEDLDGTVRVYTVTGRVGEKTRRIPHP